MSLVVRLRDPALSPSAALATGVEWMELDGAGRTDLRRRLARQTGRAVLGERFEQGEALWISNAVRLEMARSEALELLSDPEVEYVYEDVTLPCLPAPVPDRPDDAPGAPRASAAATSSWGLTSCGAREVQERLGLDGSGVVVGHIDTGVDASHQHFGGRIARFRDFTGGAGSQPYDDHGHGTHTLGVLLGGRPGASVAPGARAIVARALDATGNGKLSSLLRAMQWMLDPDGDPATRDQPFVVNSSWGVKREDMLAEGIDDRLFWDATQAMREAGMVAVFSSGNEGPGVDMVPGGYPHAMGVGAVDRAGVVPSFSTGGVLEWSGVRYLKPDLAAPGKAIRSTIPGGGFRSAQGTSQAVPHVAGIAALMHQANPGLGSREVERILLDTAREAGEAGRDSRYGEGILDGMAAVEEALNRREAAPTEPPPVTRPPRPRPPEPTPRPTPRPTLKPPEPVRPSPPSLVKPEKKQEIRRRVARIATGLAALLGLGYLLFR